jgi:hypothetical protein
MLPKNDPLTRRKPHDLIMPQTVASETAESLVSPIFAAARVSTPSPAPEAINIKAFSRELTYSFAGLFSSAGRMTRLKDRTTHHLHTLKMRACHMTKQQNNTREFCEGLAGAG